VLLFSVPLAIRGTAEMAPHTGALFTGGARYTFAPGLLLLVPLLLATDRRAGWGRHLATVIVLFVITASSGTTERSFGPAWGPALARARGDCAAGAVSVRVRIAPLSDNWRVTLPCSKL
jgi:hypothetical protein